MENQDDFKINIESNEKKEQNKRSVRRSFSIDLDNMKNVLENDLSIYIENYLKDKEKSPKVFKIINEDTFNNKNIESVKKNELNDSKASSFDHSYELQRRKSVSKPLFDPNRQNRTDPVAAKYRYTEPGMHDFVDQNPNLNLRQQSIFSPFDLQNKYESKQLTTSELPTTTNAKRKNSIINPLELNQGGNEIENDIEKNDIDSQCKHLLQDWYKFCQDQAILHDMCRSYFKSYGNNTSISAILLSTIGGASSIATNSITAKIQWLPILFGGIGVLSGALMSINRFLNLPELQRAHNFYSDEYSKLKNEIHMQLHIHKGYNKTYTNLTEFCKKCKHTLDSLIDRSPPIRSHILIEFNKSRKKKKSGSWYIPSILFNNPAFNKS